MIKKTMNAAAVCGGLVAAGLAAPAAAAPVYELRLYQVDDQMNAYITNSTKTKTLMFSAFFGSAGGSYVDISSFVEEGVNRIELELINTLFGYTYGYDFRIDGLSIASEHCGIFNTFGCNDDSYARGVVLQRSIDFTVPSATSLGQVPEPAMLALLGLGIAGLAWGRRKHI